MSKIIIENRTELSDIDCLKMVSKVIENGRVSNEGKQYAYGSSFKIDDKEYMVWTDLNKKSDRFVLANYNSLIIESK